MGARVTGFEGFIWGIIATYWAKRIHEDWRCYLIKKLEAQSAPERLKETLQAYGMRPLSEFRDPAEVLKIVKKDEAGSDGPIPTKGEVSEQKPE